LAGTIGGYVAACILGGLVLGLLVDRIVGTSPLFLITGVVVGFVLSFYFIYRLAMEAVEE
jgi:F0F1-type ATP synthase assembly protein I